MSTQVTPRQRLEARLRSAEQLALCMQKIQLSHLDIVNTIEELVRLVRAIMTPDEAQRAYDESDPVHMTEAEIDSIMQNVLARAIHKPPESK